MFYLLPHRSSCERNITGLIWVNDRMRTKHCWHNVDYHKKLFWLLPIPITLFMWFMGNLHRCNVYVEIPMSLYTFLSSYTECVYIHIFTKMWGVYSLLWDTVYRCISATPADVTAPQIITDFRNFTLDFKQLGFWASPLFLQTLISK